MKLRLALGFLGLNGLIAGSYIYKVQNENKFTLPVLMKLLEFKKSYTADPQKYSQQDIERLFDEFLVENIAITLDEKHGSEVRGIVQTLQEKYPNSREISFFASEVSDNEKRGVYLKSAMNADRKYIDEVLIRQMSLNCQRYGQEKPYFFDEFFSTCTKYDPIAHEQEANLCFSSYLALNPPNYYRAALRRIKNDSETGHASRIIDQVDDLFTHEHDLDIQEKDYLLSFIAAIKSKDLSDQKQQIKAAKLLAQGSQISLSLPFVKAVLDKDKQNVEAIDLYRKINESTPTKQTPVPNT